MKCTEEQLSEMVAAADRRCPISSTLRHAGTGGVYHVMAVALREEDLEPLVVYRRSDSRVSFARPLEEFLGRFEFVTRPGVL